jgi:peptidoglycan/LPS O-acetylase OafA/YrhL
MKNQKKTTLEICIGILQAGILIFVIALIIGTKKDYVFKSIATILLQLNFGMLLIAFGMKENRLKGKSKGNMFFAVGAAALLASVYSIYTLYTKMGM